MSLCQHMLVVAGKLAKGGAHTCIYATLHECGVWGDMSEDLDTSRRCLAVAPPDAAPPVRPARDPPALPRGRSSQ